MIPSYMKERALPDPPCVDVSCYFVLVRSSLVIVIVFPTSTYGYSRIVVVGSCRNRMITLSSIIKK